MTMNDLVDDSDITEDDDETDKYKSPNCDMMVIVPSIYLSFSP